MYWMNFSSSLRIFHKTQFLIKESTQNSNDWISTILVQWAKCILNNVLFYRLYEVSSWATYSVIDEWVELFYCCNGRRLSVAACHPTEPAEKETIRLMITLVWRHVIITMTWRRVCLTHCNGVIVNIFTSICYYLVRF